MLRNEIGRIVGLVGAQRDRVGAIGARLDHGDGGEPLSVTGDARRHGIDNEAVAVLHQRVPHEDEPGFRARSVAEQPGVAIGGRGMAVVAPPLAMKVALAVAPRTGRVARAVLRAQALGASPSLQQRPVDREMLVRQQPLDLLVRQHRGEKLARHIAVEQPVAVLGEGGRVPYRVRDAEPDKPAEQQVGVDPLDQLPLRTDRIEGLQQQGPQQPLRRDRLRPIGEYSAAKSPDSDFSAAFASSRITRSG